MALLSIGLELLEQLHYRTIIRSVVSGQCANIYDIEKRIFDRFNSRLPYQGIIIHNSENGCTEGN